MHVQIKSVQTCACNAYLRLRSLTRFQTIVLGGCSAYCLLYLLALGLHPGGRRLFQSALDVYEMLPPLFMTAACLIRAARGNGAASGRWAWAFIGLGGLSWAMSQWGWVYYEAWQGRAIPHPSWADYANLAIYPGLFAGLLLLFGSGRTAGRTRLVLDSLIAASSVGLPSWRYLVEPLWHQSGVSLTLKYVSVVSVLGDVACLFGALVLFSGASQRRRTPGDEAGTGALCLAGGIALWCFADVLGVFDTLRGSNQTGNWYEWGWYFGGLLIGHAALAPLWGSVQEACTEPAPDPPSARRHLAHVLLPSATAFSVFGLVALRDYAHAGRIEANTLAAGFLLLLLVAMRQALTLTENHSLTFQIRQQLGENERLTGRLQAFNDTLEQTVARRTEQISALRGLVKSINQTLDTESVLSAALRHTRDAFGADGAAIWLAGEEGEERLRRVRTAGLGDTIGGWLDRLPLSETVCALPLALAGASEQGVLLAAPLCCEGRTIGRIGVLRAHAPFEPSDQEMMESIGVEVGTALRHARLYAAAVEAADRDPVTQLLNHRAMHERLEAALVRAQAGAHPVSIVMIDLNGFKLFNDTYGHLTGDLVLRHVARILGEEAAPPAGADQGAEVGKNLGADIVTLLARHGGDEFLLALPGRGTGEAVELAGRLAERLRREGFRPPRSPVLLPITLSFGIAAFPDDGRDRHALLSVADGNLYASKNSEGRIQVATPDQQIHRALRAEASFSILEAMITAVDNKDRYTHAHSEDVTRYALWIAEDMGLSPETLRIVRIGGLLHDVGKIGVADEILRKPGRLTPEEYEVMQRHPHLGALIVGAIPGMESILDAVRSHHERWDGGGYPDGLVGEEIPLLGRIVAIADAFSAMTTDRPYRKGMDPEVALAEIRTHSGTQFDPALAQTFLRAAGRRLSPSAAPELRRAA